MTAPGAGRPVVAAFDVDGTLTTGDCVVPFLRRFSGRPAVALRAITELPAGVVGLATRDRDRLRAAATRAVLRGVPFDTVTSEAHRFAEHVLATRMRPDTTARLRWHVEQAHRVVLVSASYDVYLEPIAAELGAVAVLSTGLEIGADGRCTGRLAGPNCRAGEKVRRLLDWFGTTGLTREAVDLWAYGDSRGDDELLALADHPVRATRPLASVAPAV